MVITEKIKKSATILSILFILVVLLIQSFNLQVVKGVFYSQESSQYIITTSYKSAPRGNFYDKNGVLLTDNKEVFTVYLKLNNRIEENIEALKTSELYEDENLRTSIAKYTPESNQNFLLYKNVEFSRIEKLNNILGENKKDLIVESNFVRNYPFPYQYSHIIGYTKLAGEEELRSGYSVNDYVGAYRLEKQWDKVLQGKKGEQLSLDNTLIEIPPSAGGSVKLTLDNNWQGILYNLFRKYDDLYKGIGSAGGGGVVLDIETGEIIALVSYPGFDTNSLTLGISKQDYDALLFTREKPLIDKAIGTAASPGSTFKLVTSYSLLENGTITPNSSYFSNRCIKLSSTTEFCEFGKNFYGQMDLNRALYVSSNLYFCHYIQKLEESKGIETFVKNANQLGIGESLSIDLEGAVQGNMDSPEYKSNVEGLDWFAGNSCNAAIGQGAVLVTPLHMALVVAALENHGKIPKPFVVREVTDYSGVEVYKVEPEIERQVFIEKEHAEAILAGMRSVVVNYESAVAPFLKDLPGNVRAKTGSAETFEFFETGGYAERTHSWIVGSFEKNGRKYAFAFFQQYGGGGYYIAPMLMDFINEIYAI
ncbi:MAG: penicillin-binding protein 2 [Candidatus Dojkabacteria bacterium]